MIFEFLLTLTSHDIPLKSPWSLYKSCISHHIPMTIMISPLWLFWYPYKIPILLGKGKPEKLQELCQPRLRQSDPRGVCFFGRVCCSCVPYCHLFICIYSIYIYYILFNILYFIILYFILFYFPIFVLYHIILYFIILSYIIVYYILFFNFILYYFILFFLYYNILYYIIIILYYTIYICFFLILLYVILFHRYKYIY